MEAKYQLVGPVALVVIGDFDYILASLAINSYCLGAAGKSWIFPTTRRA